MLLYYGPSSLLINNYLLFFHCPNPFYRYSP